ALGRRAPEGRDRALDRERPRGGAGGRADGEPRHEERGRGARPPPDALGRKERRRGRREPRPARRGPREPGRDAAGRARRGRAMTLWSMAARNLARNRRRSLLTGGVVVFGFAAFALAGGFMAQSLEGLREGTIRGGVGHLQLARPGAFTESEEATLERGLERAQEAARITREVPGVAYVLPRIDFQGLVTNGKRSIPFLG